MAKIRNPLMVINVTEGGTTPPVEQETYLCRVVDWEGTILKEEWLPSGATFTMPADPTYEGLVFDGWSSPVDIVDNAVVVEDMDIIIGAIYHTASGLTEIDIELTKGTGLSVTIPIQNATSVDWGDGSTNTGSTHTYANYGKYTIKINGSTFKYTNSNVGAFGQGSSPKNSYVIAIRFANTITTIPAYAFQYCVALKKISLPNSITNLYGTFINNCDSLDCVVIPNISATYVSNATGDLGRDCKNLKTIVIPKVINTINDYYGYSSAVEYISIPKGANIGASFLYVTPLKRLAINAGTLGNQFIYSCRLLEKVKLTTTSTTLMNNSFANCYNLKNVEINSDTLTTLGNSVLSNCQNLESVKLPDSITTIGNNVCSTAYALKEIKIPENTLTIGNNFCQACYNLEKISMPNSVTAVGTNFCSSCQNLQNFVVSTSLTELPSGYYNGASAVKDKEIIIPDNINFVPLRGMYLVESIVLPANLQTLNSQFGSYMYNCKLFDFRKVAVVPVRDNQTTSLTFFFEGMGKDIKIVVPDALYDTWIADSNWINLADCIYSASEYDTLS